MSKLISKKGIDLVISFDTTGSMYPCLSQLRRKVQESIRKLFREIPDLRVGIIAHGDYYDSVVPSSYVVKALDLTTDQSKICNFVQTVGKTYGGDAPECYELVLHEARGLTWKAGKAKAFVLIGDDVPHGPEYKEHVRLPSGKTVLVENKKRLDWRNEIDVLQQMNVSVYGVQALNRKTATPFYEEIARKTGGFHLALDQFSHISDLITAIAFKQEGPGRLQAFEAELVKTGKMNRSYERSINKLLGKKNAKSRYKSLNGLDAVSPGRFQVMRVDRDIPITNFVSEQGVTFDTGRGFYEFTKRVLVQANKEVVLMDDVSGDLFSGAKARKMLNLPKIGVEPMKISPTDLPGYTAFIQSTSFNRKLLSGTRFLYEVDNY